MNISNICKYLEEFAPTRLAEDWDNVGLLLGDREGSVARVMTCLTLTQQSVAEAALEQADLVITHHPLPFRSLKRITTDTTPGRLLWELARAGIAIYSPHTAFDSAPGGINQQLATGLGLENIAPLIVPDGEQPALGSGRFGMLPEPMTIADVATRIRELLKIEDLRAVVPREQTIQRIAVACGSGGSLLDAAHRQGCQLFVTGETTFHTCLEAESLGIDILLTGHYASERFAVENLADLLRNEFPNLNVWASQKEADPVRRI